MIVYPLIEEMILEAGINQDIVKLVYESSKKERADRKNLYNRYKCEDIPIKKRENKNKMKINNKLNNPFDADIVDQKTGYFAGIPATFSIDDDIQQKTLSEFLKDNHYADLDSEATRQAAITGKASRLLYINSNGEPAMVNINPWEVVTVGNPTEPTASFRFIRKSSNDKIKYLVKVYYQNNIIDYELIESDKIEIILKKETINLFKNPTLFDIPNNEDLQSDTYKVLSLIDDYDRLLSDSSNDREQFTNAILAMYGFKIEKGSEETLKTSSLLDDLDINSKIEYITKDINDAFLENQKNTREKNIYKFAKAVNFDDISFGGNISGIAMKFKIFNLENKCITFENKMKRALFYQFKLLSDVYSLKNIKLDYKNIKMTFIRRIPINLSDEAETAQKLINLVSNKTILENLSIVENVEKELERINEESGETKKIDISEDE